MKTWQVIKKSLKPGLIILVSFIITTSIPFVVYGVSFSSNPIEISGSHRIKNDEEIKTGRHTFILTATDDAPMPEGSEEGVRKVTIGSNEDFSFGRIDYDAPGIYEYTVSREAVESRDLIQDNSVYYCHVEVMKDGTAVVVFHKKDTEGKPNRIIYTDEYIGRDEDTNTDPNKNTDADTNTNPGRNTNSNTDRTAPTSTNNKSRGDPVYTGDRNNTYTHLIVLSVSLITLLIILVKRYRRYKRE